MVGMTYEQGDKLAGISVQSTEPFCDESFAKTVALSRLVIEASAQKNLLQGNEKRIIFDIGEVDLNEKNYVKRGEIARKQLTGTGVKVGSLSQLCLLLLIKPNILTSTMYNCTNTCTLHTISILISVR